jgi:hypothetical protein
MIRQTTEEFAEYGIYEHDYERVGEILSALFTQKIETASEGYKMMKRYKKNGIRGFCEAHRWYTAVTGYGLKDIMTAVMDPKPANKDQDFVTCVEDWEDKYTDAIKMGMEELSDMQKIFILQELLPEINTPGGIKEQVEQEFHIKYRTAREQIMRWARYTTTKAAERRRGAGRNPNAIEEDCGAAKVLGQGGDDQTSNNMKNGGYAGDMDAFGKGGKGGTGKGAPWNNGKGWNKGKGYNNNYKGYSSQGGAK